MNEYSINIPADTDSMRINHLPFLLELNEFKGKDISIVDKCRLNSVFTGIDFDTLKKHSKADNLALFNEITKSYGEYTPKAIPTELNYEGKCYTLRIDFTLHPVDWDDDLKRAWDGFKDNPIDLVSFIYIEKGMAYGEGDEQQNPINPREARNEIFEKHLPLSTFLDIQGFFLWSYTVLQLHLTTEKNRKKQRIKRSLR